MEANELMIGNYYYGTNNIVSQVEPDIYMNFYINGCFAKSIPLTEEWAIMFGFECLVEMAVYLSSESKYDIEITSEDLINMKVHEVQNLCHILTGEHLKV